MSDIPLYQALQSILDWFKQIIVLLGTTYIVPNISLLSIFIGGIMLTMVLSIFWKGQKG